MLDDANRDGKRVRDEKASTEIDRYLAGEVKAIEIGSAPEPRNKVRYPTR